MADQDSPIPTPVKVEDTAITVQPNGAITIRTGAIISIIVAAVTMVGNGVFDGLFRSDLQERIEVLENNQAESLKLQRSSSRLVNVIFKVLIKDNPNVSISLEDLRDLEDYETDGTTP